MRVLITGAGGMLGSALLAQAPPGFEIRGIDLADGDLSVPGVAEEIVAAEAPEVVIHCAAWTDVEGCTRDPERAWRHNATATRYVAEACQRQQARLLYISTDYVFAGDLGRPYVENDTPRPLNVYGESKLEGERAVAQLPHSLIVRTQWLFGPGGKNFVATIVQAARTKRELRVVADEWGSPTYTHDLAGGLWRLVSEGLTGLIHLTNSGICTWHELAKRAVQAAGLQAEIHAITAEEWGSPTRRPRYAPLENRRWRELGYPPLRPWTEAVKEYVREHLMKEEADG